MHYPTRHPLPTLEDRIVAHLSLSPATRSQLCEALDTSRTNLGRALATLLDEGSVVPVRSNAPGRGRPTQLLTLNASAAHAVGLLVTRTSCAAVMLSRSGTVLAAAHIVSPASPTLLECLEQTCEALSASASSQGIDVSRVRAVGVGAPIPMGRHARVASDAYPNVEDVASVTGRWWQAVPVVDNTVRMAAFAEGLWGAGSGMSSFIYLRLSGGVGGCVVSDFRLVGGATGLAGELGHITVAGNDALCGCGKRGCVETLASVPALCERAGARDLIVDAFPSLRESIAAHMGAELLPVMEWDIDVVAASLGPLGAAQGCAYIAAHPSGEDADRERAPHRGGATASPGVGVRAGGEPS